ncbi:MCE family protein [Nocardioides sp. KR10-350]|uniref:MCE family protein n=1 Tax=Nocardioides cheoyonin TaxID=3156615 RepID=UPI0032B3E5BF
MTPFHERNPVKIGAVSIMVIALLIGLSFKADSLPLIGGGTTYYADFAEAGGLQSGDEVRIAGVRVGKVSSIELDGNKVKVGFKVKTDSGFGTDSRAAIKVKTLLGDMFLDLQPAGPGQLDKGSTIPESRTQSPYDVVQAFSGLADTAGKIDTDQLAKSLTTLSDLTRTTPTSFREALDGVSRLSKNLAAKDERINTLLKNLDTVTSTLDERDQDLVALMKDANALFGALVKRRQAVHNLLVSTTELSQQLNGLIKDTKADLKPALDHLDSVVDVLNKNEDNLDETLRLAGPFYRVFANVLGNGPWFDSYIQNLPPVPAVTQ